MQDTLVSAAQVARAAVRLSDLCVMGDAAFWVESRPAENGRCVAVRRRGMSAPEDILVAPYSARSRVHEYGGGAIVPTPWGLVFSNDADQALYLSGDDRSVRTLTSGNFPKQVRFSDGAVDPRRKRLIFVREDHRVSGHEPRAALVTINAEHGDGVGDYVGDEIVTGSDFYSSPRVSPDGSRLCWLSWSHPRMPWHGTELWVAAIFDDGSLGESRLVAGGASESIVQPEWSPSGNLYWMSDVCGYWNPCCFENGVVRRVWQVPYDCAKPHWVFGVSTYAFISDHELAVSFCDSGLWRLNVVDVASGRAAEMSNSFTDFGGVRACQGRIVAIASSFQAPPHVELFGPAIKIPGSEGQELVDFGRAADGIRAPCCASSEPPAPEVVFVPTPRGPVNCLYYKPFAIREDASPLILKPHGGPVSQASSGYSMQIQYWQSRGYAFVDVNYGGSTGFGRAYRERLCGGWGEVDVDDCCRAVEFLVEKGMAAPGKIFLSGSSAGGFTVLGMLARDTRSWIRCAALYYAVSDLSTLAAETHKFEKYELAWLLGPKERFQKNLLERSPCHFAERILTPLVVFQGLDDMVVPPSQSERLVRALRSRGVRVDYHSFAGEGHGFRKAETIARAVELETQFFEEIL